LNSSLRSFEIHQFPLHELTMKGLFTKVEHLFWRSARLQKVCFQAEAFPWQV